MRLARVLVVFSSVHAYEGFRESHGETGNAQSFIVHIEKSNFVQPTEELPIVQRRPPKAASLITVSIAVYLTPGSEGLGQLSGS